MVKPVDDAIGSQCQIRTRRLRRRADAAEDDSFDGWNEQFAERVPTFRSVWRQHAVGAGSQSQIRFDPSRARGH